MFVLNNMKWILHSIYTIFDNLFYYIRLLLYYQWAIKHILMSLQNAKKMEPAEFLFFFYLIKFDVSSSMFIVEYIIMFRN